MTYLLRPSGVKHLYRLRIPLLLSTALQPSTAEVLRSSTGPQITTFFRNKMNSRAEPSCGRKQRFEEGRSPLGHDAVQFGDVSE